MSHLMWRSQYCETTSNARDDYRRVKSGGRLYQSVREKTTAVNEYASLNDCCLMTHDPWALKENERLGQSHMLVDLPQTCSIHESSNKKIDSTPLLWCNWTLLSMIHDRVIFSDIDNIHTFKQMCPAYDHEIGVAKKIQTGYDSTSWSVSTTWSWALSGSLTISWNFHQ